MNAMKLAELNDETKFIFRKGMLLRQWQVDKLFRFGTRPEVYPEYIEYANSGQIKGLVNVAPVYDSTLFKMGCRKLYNMYIKDPKQKIDKDIVNDLSDAEFRSAFFSGYLKHDARGYYFDTDIRAILEVKKNA